MSIDIKLTHTIIKVEIKLLVKPSTYQFVHWNVLVLGIFLGNGFYYPFIELISYQYKNVSY